MSKHSPQVTTFVQSFGGQVEIIQECKTILGIKAHAMLQKGKYPNWLEEKGLHSPSGNWSWKVSLEDKLSRAFEHQIKKFGVENGSNEEPSKISNQGTDGIQFGFWIRNFSFSAEDELEGGDT